MVSDTPALFALRKAPSRKITKDNKLITKIIILIRLAEGAVPEDNKKQMLQQKRHK